MTDLVTWLRPLVEARKAAAEAATPGPWTAKQVVYWAPPDPDIWQIWAGSEVVVSHQHHEGGGIDSEANADHIALNDPRQVIADCEADLAILAEHRRVNFTDPELGFVDEPVCWLCHIRLDVPDGYEEDSPEYENWSFPLVQEPYPCRTVRLLAWRYRHRDPSGYAAVAGGWEP